MGLFVGLLLVLFEEVLDGFFQKVSQGPALVNRKVFEVLDSVFVDSGGEYFFITHGPLLIFFYERKQERLEREYVIK